jgi:hypothetical protein
LEKIALEATFAKARLRYLTLTIPESPVTSVLKGNIVRLAPLLQKNAQLELTMTRRVRMTEFTASNVLQLKLASQRAWLPQAQTVHQVIIALLTLTVPHL